MMTNSENSLHESFSQEIYDWNAANSILDPEVIIKHERFSKKPNITELDKELVISINNILVFITSYYGL